MSKSSSSRRPTAEAQEAHRTRLRWAQAHAETASDAARDSRKALVEALLDAREHLTITDIAALLGVSRQTVYEWIKNSNEEGS